MTAVSGTLDDATTQVAAARPSGRERAWPVTALLVALAAIPVTSGVLRLVQLAGGPQIMPADGRFTASPAAVVLHVVAAAVFALAGAFQYLPRFRRRGRSWHRRAGRVVAAAGLLVAGTALWLTLGYPAKPGTGDVLYLARLVVGSATAASLVLGVAAIRRRDVAAHRAWMIRAYALGLGAGTQVFTEGFGGALFGTGVLVGDLEKIAGWVVNAVVAEYVIRRSPGRTRQAPALTAAGTLS
jgi:uncharacterized membrane protein